MYVDDDDDDTLSHVIVVVVVVVVVEVDLSRFIIVPYVRTVDIYLCEGRK